MKISTNKNGLSMTITKIENVDQNVEVSIVKFNKNIQTEYDKRKFRKEDHNKMNQFIINES